MGFCWYYTSNNTILVKGNFYLQNGYQTEWLDELKRRSNIVTVISKYIRLEHKGRKYWGCCPFHNEKTPSFCVDEDEGFYHCFGCKESGDVITFVEKMESCDFIDAVKILAEQNHMDIPEISHSNEDVMKKKEEKDRVLKVLEEAYKHYVSNLYLPSAKKAQEYIKSRGFTKRELDDFQIGYSNSWTEIITYLKSKGFSYEDMLKAGIVSKNEDGKYFDAIGNRLVFPIFNSFNECIGFSARVLEKTDFAKYKNTAETIVFQKNKVVFGINLLKKLKQEGNLKKIVFVEGQIDVIAMHRAGFKETVACLGTALTENHAKELKKLCDSAILCFDGDGAGIKATIRSIEILRQAGFNIKIATLPEGLDPDEVLKKQGKEKMAEYLNNALSVMDYLILTEQKKYNLNDAEQKGKFVKTVLEHLRKLDEASAQEPYLDKIRDLTNIPIDVLRRDLTKKNENVDRPELKEEKVAVREGGNAKAEKFIIASILYSKDYVNRKINYKKLMPRLEKYIDIAQSGKKISSIFTEYDVNSDNFLKDVINYNFEEFAGIEEKYFSECVWSLAEEILKGKQQEVSKKFGQATDIEQRKTLMLELQDILGKIKNKNLEDFND